ncbi:hypothetical protein [Bradyrhizobium sp. WSM2793]|uniref:hypothetical protein n=1 Tax=Bradyrhizobium sp. WSM2793 TaxID=1038866 RepID=UPI000376CFB1|nr:hypothetical protein [Bradyrhizobium sp. WSM2793]
MFGTTVPETLINRAMHRQDESSRIQETTGGVWQTLWSVRLSLLAVILLIGSVQIASYAWNRSAQHGQHGLQGA